MTLLSKIRKWLRESPHHLHSNWSDTKPLGNLPILEIELSRNVSGGRHSTQRITYQDPTWIILDRDSMMAAACIMQSEILNAYKNYLAGTPNALPYLHISELVIKFSDITWISVHVTWEDSKLAFNKESLNYPLVDH
jgi:hypothetical protein